MQGHSTAATIVDPKDTKPPFPLGEMTGFLLPSKPINLPSYVHDFYLPRQSLCEEPRVGWGAE